MPGGGRRARRSAEPRVCHHHLPVGTEDQMPGRFQAQRLPSASGKATLLPMVRRVSVVSGGGRLTPTPAPSPSTRGLGLGCQLVHHGASLPIPLGTGGKGH